MTTTDSDLSLALAQLSLMLAGFASVAISIRPIRVRDEDARWRLYSLLSICFGALFLSLLHVLLSTTNLHPDYQFRICSALMALFNAGWYLKLGSAVHEEHIRSGVVTAAVLTIGGINTVLQTLNAVGQPFSDYGVFLAGLVWYLLAGVLTLGSSLDSSN